MAAHRRDRVKDRLRHGRCPLNRVLLSAMLAV